MRECKLIELFHQHHGVCPAIPTYANGNRLLDYAIRSSSLFPFIQKCAFLSRISSNHRGLLLVDLSLEIIDGLTCLEHIPRRFLHSSFQRDVFKYKLQVHKEFQPHNVFNKAADLYHTSGPIKHDNPEYKECLEKLDKLIVEIQLKAETQCCLPRTRYNWSDEMHHFKIILNYYMIQRKGKINNKKVKEMTLKIYLDLPDIHQQYIDIGTGSTYTNWMRTKKKLVLLMAQHRKNLAQAQKDSFDNEAAFLGTSSEQVK
jgi:hypothetical protein